MIYIYINVTRISLIFFMFFYSASIHGLRAGQLQAVVHICKCIFHIFHSASIHGLRAGQLQTVVQEIRGLMHDLLR